MSPNPHETARFVTFTEEILNGEFPFLCSEIKMAAITSWLQENVEYVSNNLQDGYSQRYLTENRRVD